MSGRNDCVVQGKQHGRSKSSGEFRFPARNLFPQALAVDLVRHQRRRPNWVPVHLQNPVASPTPARVTAPVYIYQLYDPSARLLATDPGVGRKTRPNEEVLELLSR